MPICEGCGSSYDNQFSFCPHCGRSKPEPNTININVTMDDVWETCEIRLVEQQETRLNGFLILKTERLFEAQAIGPQGGYNAGRSEILKQSSSFSPIANGDFSWSGANVGTRDIILIRRKCQPKIDELIKKLVTDGWQSTGRGQEWYNERFRRKVKK